MSKKSPGSSNPDPSAGSKWSHLSTIKDFDFGIGDPTSPAPIVRISDLCPTSTNGVSGAEINLIVWLLLEREVSSCHGNSTSGTNGTSGIGGAGAGDSVDSHSISSRTPPATRKRAYNYAENLLRAVGVNVPFELLDPDQRAQLFQLFSSSSNLLLGQRYSSILDLYEALSRRSKFREEFQKDETQRILGSGAFGKVLAVNRTDASSSPAPSAIKIVPISSLDSLDSILMVVNESSVLGQLSKPAPHPNIVGYRDSWLEWDSGAESLVFYLEMELCGESLAERKPDLGQQGTLWKITSQLVDALEWIHGKGFMHLDINPRNILWSNPNRCPGSQGPEPEISVKLTDFGLAVQAPTLHGRVGTLPYTAPENTLTPKSDVYSLGISLFELASDFGTRSEFIMKLEALGREGSCGTGIEFLDQIIPLMLKKQASQRIGLADLKLALEKFDSSVSRAKPELLII